MEDSFDFVPPTSVLAPAIMAVAAVNIIIVAYVVKAFRWYEIPCSTYNIRTCKKTSIYGLFLLTGSSQISMCRFEVNFDTKNFFVGIHYIIWHFLGGTS